MLENHTHGPAESGAAVKRYAPPNQRNRTLNRRKSGDRFDRPSYGNDGEKNYPITSRNLPVLDHGDAGSSTFLNENPHIRLIALDGCCRSEASQLSTERWAAVMHLYNNTSTELSEKPVMYSGNNASAWGHIRLPHQMMSSSNSAGLSSGSQMDFLSELRRAMRNSSTSTDN